MPSLRLLSLRSATRLAVVLGVLAGSGCGDVANESSFSDSDAAWKLAVIDRGSADGVRDAQVHPYDNVLHALDPKCRETRDQLGDMAVAARNLLREKGSDRSVLDVLEGVDRASSARRDVPCADVAAMWVTTVITNGG
jgi:hypothetical protein